MEGENNEMVPVDKSEFDRLIVRVDTIEKEQNNMKIEQGVQGTRLTTIEKTLDKISNNVSRTMWAVIVGIFMMVVNYFWNPPTPKTEVIPQLIQAWLGG